MRKYLIIAVLAAIGIFNAFYHSTPAFSHRSLGLVLKRSPSSTSPHCYGSWWDDVQFLCYLSGVHRRSVLSTLRDMYSDHRDGIRTVDHDLEAEIISPKKL